MDTNEYACRQPGILRSHSIGAASGTYLKSMERKTIASLGKALEVFIRLLHDPNKNKDCWKLLQHPAFTCCSYFAWWQMR